MAAPKVGSRWGSKSLVAATATLISAGLDATAGVIVQNLTGADIWVGPDNTVSNSKGLKIADGSELTVQWGEDTYGYSVAGGTVQYAHLVHYAG